MRPTAANLARWSMAPILLALLAAPVAHAGLLPDHPYTGSLGFPGDLGQADAFLSGSIEARSADVDLGALWLDAAAFAIDGIQRVCWENDSGGSATCQTAPALRILIEDGSGVALRSPSPFSLDFAADHVLAFFADLDATVDLSEDLGFGPSLVGVATAGVTTVSSFDAVPVTTASGYSSYAQAKDDLALLFTLAEGSRLTVMSGPTPLKVMEGRERYVGFQGTAIRFDDVVSDVVGLPMPDGSSATLTRATSADAADGLDPQRVVDAVASLEESVASDSGDSEEEALAEVDTALKALGLILNGALFGVDGDADGPLADLTLVRFDSLTATSDGDGVDIVASGPLVIQGGAVEGAGDLIVVLPWWSFVLFFIAIALWITRLAVKAPRKHKTWSRYSWIGWVGGFVASAVVFVIWDTVVRDLWGVSILSGRPEGAAAAAFIATVQLVPLGLAGLAAGLPFRSIFHSVMRLSKQGDFMRLGAVIAPFVTLAAGILLMLDLVGALIDALSGGGFGSMFDG